MAVFCVSYRIEHYEDDPPYTLGCHFVDAEVPGTVDAAQAIAEKAEKAVRERYKHAARNYMVKSFQVTSLHRLDTPVPT